jgi:hypothetical protein
MALDRVPIHNTLILKSSVIANNHGNERTHVLVTADVTLPTTTAASIFF